MSHAKDLPGKALNVPASIVGFHALATAFFGGASAWLLLEARALSGRQGLLGLALALASAALTLLSLLALVRLLRARAPIPLASRAHSETYFQVLAAVAALALFSLRLFTVGARPALATFCLGLAVWLLALGFHLVPALFLASEGFVDHLGRRTPFSRLEWFELHSIASQPPRLLLRAGRGSQFYIQARLAEPPDVLRQALTRAGLRPRR